MPRIKMPTHIDPAMAARMMGERYTMQIASIEGVRLYIAVEGDMVKFEVTNGLQMEVVYHLSHAIREFNAMLGYEEEGDDA